MVDGFVLSVLPKLADVAIVLRRYLSAVDAHFRSPLRCSTQHAEHVLGLLSNESMVFGGVVAEAASIPSLASRALELDVPFVVFAA
jgi:hypothetical protein